MKRKMFAGSTSVMLPIFVVDSSSSTGAGLGLLVFNTSSLVGEYRREDQATWTTISLSTATLGTFTSGGWIADGGLAGAYEVGIPNAAIAAGGGARWCVVRYYGAGNMVPILIEIEIDAVNYQSSTAFVASVPAVVGNVGGNVTGNVGGNVGGNVTGTVASVVGNVGGNVGGTVASVVGNVAGNVTGSVGSVTAAVTLPANPPSGFLVTASYANPVPITSNIKRNQAIPNFTFVMTDATSHGLRTGLTVTATRSLDGAAFAACANAPAEISGGYYQINLATTDTNAATVSLLFTATGADTLPVSFQTQP